MNELQYSHTTVEWVPTDKLNVWEHERDKRDYESGREDVSPIENGVMDAILSHYIMDEEMIGITHHLSHSVPSVVKNISTTITVGEAE